MAFTADLESRQSIRPVWALLCFAIGAGLAAWSLYLLGLIFLLVIGPFLTTVPASRRARAAAVIAMAVGFESGIAFFLLMYAYVWGEPSEHFWAYLLGLGIAGAAILGLTAWASLGDGPRRARWTHRPHHDSENRAGASLGRPSSSATPWLWAVIGFGLGGFLGVEAIGYAAWFILVLPGGIAAALAVRVAIGRSARSRLDLAGYLLGSGLPGLFWLIPVAAQPNCRSFSAAGGCSPAGGCYTTATTYSDCSSNAALWLVVAAYIALVVAGGLLIVAARRSRGSARPGQETLAAQ